MGGEREGEGRVLASGWVGVFARKIPEAVSVICLSPLTTGTSVLSDPTQIR